jgi:hypothetical protein
LQSVNFDNATQHAKHTSSNIKFLSSAFHQQTVDWLQLKTKIADSIPYNAVLSAKNSQEGNFGREDLAEAEEISRHWDHCSRQWKQARKFLSTSLTGVKTSNFFILS